MYYGLLTNVVRCAGPWGENVAGLCPVRPVAGILFRPGGCVRSARPTRRRPLWRDTCMVDDILLRSKKRTFARSFLCLMHLRLHSLVLRWLATRRLETCPTPHAAPLAHTAKLKWLCPSGRSCSFRLPFIAVDSCILHLYIVLQGRNRNHQARYIIWSGQMPVLKGIENCRLGALTKFVQLPLLHLYFLRAASKHPKRNG